jgi:hypothetical protein
MNDTFSQLTLGISLAVLLVYLLQVTLFPLLDHAGGDHADRSLSVSLVSQLCSFSRGPR